MPEPSNDQHLKAMTVMTYQGILLFVGFLFLLLLGGLAYGLWGDAMDGWFTPAPPPVERRPAPVAQAQASGSVLGTDARTGLVIAPGYELVRTTCTACHSAQLVTQNRATRAGWEQMIRWMQAKQGLWDLGEQEDEILDYLATHYAPEAAGRRAVLEPETIEWYALE